MHAQGINMAVHAKADINSETVENTPKYKAVYSVIRSPHYSCSTRTTTASCCHLADVTKGQVLLPL